MVVSEILKCLEMSAYFEKRDRCAISKEILSFDNVEEKSCRLYGLNAFQPNFEHLVFAIDSFLNFQLDVIQQLHILRN